MKEMIVLMKSKWLLLVAALVLAFGAFAVAGCSMSDEPTDEGTGSETPAVKYVVATDAPYPPFENIDEATGKHFGFDMDILNAIAENQGFEVEYMTYNFDAMLAGLAGEPTDFDFAMSAITITEERAQSILFSDPYFNAAQSLSVPKGAAIKTTADLKSGMKVAVQTGTTGFIWAEENLKPKGIEIMNYPQGVDCFNAMLAGDVDACVVDLAVAAEYAADDALDAVVVETIETAEQYGIGFPKSATDLHAQVNAGLKAIIADGTYAKIYKEWFGVEPTNL